ncbi:MAG: MerR family transcriptional regulator [Pyrinomonadaceae bacterium]
MEERFGRGEAAKRIGVTKNTLFRWEKKGLINPAKRDRNNYCVYTSEDIEKIKKWKNEIKDPEQGN